MRTLDVVGIVRESLEKHRSYVQKSPKKSECPYCSDGVQKRRTPDHAAQARLFLVRYKFIVTVILLLCTIIVGGSPPHNTSRSLT